MNQQYYELGTVKEILTGRKTKALTLVAGRKINIQGTTKFMEDNKGDILAVKLEWDEDPNYQRQLKEWEQTKGIVQEAAGQ